MASDKLLHSDWSVPQHNDFKYFEYHPCIRANYVLSTELYTSGAGEEEEKHNKQLLSPAVHNQVR